MQAVDSPLIHVSDRTAAGLRQAIIDAVSAGTGSVVDWQTAEMWILADRVKVRFRFLAGYHSRFTAPEETLSSVGRHYLDVVGPGPDSKGLPIRSVRAVRFVARG